MATEIAFQNKFVKPLVECYGQTKLPMVRIQKIWERVKELPDHLIAQCADRIILNFDNFPGVQGILNTCAEVGGEYARAEGERLKAEVKCIRCRSQGVVVANNYAYKCTCQLGELLYPYYPRYQGQVHIQDKFEVDAEGNKTFENATYQSFVPAGCTDVRQVRTIIKEQVIVFKKPEPKGPKMMSFDDFTPGPA